MTSLMFGRDFKFSINFVTEKGQLLGFPVQWLHYWSFDGAKLRIFFHSSTIELEGIFLDNIIRLLEEGSGFKVMQIPKRYVETTPTKEVIVWGMNFITID